MNIAACPECSIFMVSKRLYNDSGVKTKSRQLHQYLYQQLGSENEQLHSEWGLFCLTESINRNNYYCLHPTIFVGDFLKEHVQLECDKTQIWLLRWIPGRLREKKVATFFFFFLGILMVGVSAGFQLFRIHRKCSILLFDWATKRFWDGNARDTIHTRWLKFKFRKHKIGTKTFRPNG